MSPFRTSVLVFRRDLRLEDNPALRAALQESQRVLLAFVFTPEQVDADRNPYCSSRAVAFMLASLNELQRSLQDLQTKRSLVFLYGDNADVLEALHAHFPFDAVFENADVTPYARARTQAVQGFCARRGVVHRLLQNGLSLYPMGQFLKADGQPYLRFSPFHRTATRAAPPPTAPTGSCLDRAQAAKLVDPVAAGITLLPFAMTKARFQALGRQFPPSLLVDAIVRGGRAEALNLLEEAATSLSKYNDTRDFPAQPTSRLGAHLHFGTVSPREVYWRICQAYGARHGLLEQLLWREFYLYIMQYKNTGFGVESATLPAMSRLSRFWQDASRSDGFQRWQQGTTGCPIVDAGMRQLQRRGWMHNRLRMIVAHYLIFYLRIHWKEGERFFSQSLVDIDFCNNRGGWLWCSGQETHSNPWFRIFAMPSQSKRFDPDGAFIRQWCPELQRVPAAHIHDWHLHFRAYPDATYPTPHLPNLKATRQEALNRLRELLQDTERK